MIDKKKKPHSSNIKQLTRVFSPQYFIPKGLMTRAGPDIRFVFTSAPLYVMKIVENVDKIASYLRRNRICRKTEENAVH